MVTSYLFTVVFFHLNYRPKTLIYRRQSKVLSQYTYERNKTHLHGRKETSNGVGCFYTNEWGKLIIVSCMTKLCRIYPSQQPMYELQPENQILK